MANKKLDKLLSRSKELAEELKAKEEAKAKLDNEIEKLQIKELKAFLISNKMGLNPEFYDMALLVKQIMDSGVKPDEIREMVGIEVSAENTADKKEPENKQTEEKEKDEK